MNIKYSAIDNLSESLGGNIRSWFWTAYNTAPSSKSSIVAWSQSEKGSMVSIKVTGVGSEMSLGVTGAVRVIGLPVRSNS